jgi:hypothetical protein
MKTWWALNVSTNKQNLLLTKWIENKHFFSQHISFCRYRRCLATNVICFQNEFITQKMKIVSVENNDIFVVFVPEIIKLTVKLKLSIITKIEFCQNLNIKLFLGIKKKQKLSNFSFIWKHNTSFRCSDLWTKNSLKWKDGCGLHCFTKKCCLSHSSYDEYHFFHFVKSRPLFCFFVLYILIKNEN